MKPLASLEDLIAAYQSGMSTPAIAKKFGYTHCTPVVIRLRNAGIKFRDRKLAPLNSIISDYQSGMTTGQIAKKYGYASHYCVYNILAGHNVPKFVPDIYNRVLSADEIDFINGALLGDSYARYWFKAGIPRGYVKFAHTTPQEEYLRWKHSFLGNLVNPIHIYQPTPNTIAINPSVEFTTKTLPQFVPFIQSFYPVHKKVIPENLTLGALGLSIWYMDDGCIDKRWRRVHFATCGFTKMESEFLLSLLNTTFGLRGSVVKAGRGYYEIVLSAHSFLDFVDIVDPYIIPSMRYKISC